jgi:hypothetical protein
LIDLSGHKASDALRFWLRKGQRVKAAEHAREAASQTTSTRELRAIVDVLAAALESIGDVRGKGRPPALDPDNVTLRAVREDARQRRKMRAQFDKAAAVYAALLDADATIASRHAAPDEKARARDAIAPTGLRRGRTFATRARDYAAREAGIDPRRLRSFLTK